MLEGSAVVEESMVSAAKPAQEARQQATNAHQTAAESESYPEQEEVQEEVVVYSPLKD